jgi:hypothetical protein
MVWLRRPRFFASRHAHHREFRMATSTAEGVGRLAEHDSSLAASDIRIDAPHQLGDAPDASPLPTASVVPPEEPDLLEQLRKQAHQLAQHLRIRQREVDQREARLNAQQSTMEKEIRSERLWLLERRAELAELADDLVRRECELQERASRVSAAEEHLAHARRQEEQSAQQNSEQLGQRAEELDALAAQLQAQRAAIEMAQRRLQAQRRRQRQAQRLARQSITTQRAAAEVQHRGLLEGIERQRARLELEAERLAQRETAWLDEATCRQAEHDAQIAQFIERGQLLERSEAALEQEWEELRRQQEQATLIAREREAQHQAALERAEIERQEWQGRLQDEQVCLARRGEELDSRQVELEQLQQQLRQVHKETLQTRLAAEELLGQLSGAVPAAALTSSISRLRRRLDDQFRLAQSDLTQQRQALEGLRAILTERHEQLVQQKAELQDWVRQREATIEQQAARLVAREQELDLQQEQFQSFEHRWQEERQGYQQEIRRLLSRLRREELPA